MAQRFRAFSRCVKHTGLFRARWRIRGVGDSLPGAAHTTPGVGLLISNEFLGTRTEFPRAWLWVRGLVVGGMLGIALLILFRLHDAAVWFAFGYLGFVAVLVVTLFALALTARMRFQERAREPAEQLARIDPMTGLLNRRAFDELALRPFSFAMRRHRPLCSGHAQTVLPGR